MAKELKYEQIKKDIISDIENGVLKPGDKVSSESKLKAKYNVSTITVRKAFTDLISEGYLVGVQGLGTFVKKQMIRDLTSISFSEELVNQGYKIGLALIKVEEVVDSVISEKLNLPPKTLLTKISRVRTANNNHVAYQTTYVENARFSASDGKLIKKFNSLYNVFDEKNIHIEWVNENYSVAILDDQNIADALHVKLGEATFKVKRLAFDEKDSIVEYSETYFNKDWYSVTVNIRRQY